MAALVRMFLVLCFACIFLCYTEAQQQSNWAVAEKIKNRDDHVEGKSDDGIDSEDESKTGNKRRRSLTQSDRTDSVTMMNNLRRTKGSSNMPYLSYDVGAENDADSWTFYCNFDRSFDASNYVNGFKYLTTNSISVSGAIKELFKLFPREMSSVYLTSFGCDMNQCTSATYNGQIYKNARLILCPFNGESGYDQSKVQYSLGEGCTECLSGSFWCDYGLCRADCTSSDSCYCNSYCLNCADTNGTTCRCQCLQGWSGSRCESMYDMNAATPTCSTTARPPKKLTTISLTADSPASIGTPILQIAFCAICAFVLFLGM